MNAVRLYLVFCCFWSVVGSPYFTRLHPEFRSDGGIHTASRCWRCAEEEKTGDVQTALEKQREKGEKERSRILLNLKLKFRQ